MLMRPITTADGPEIIGILNHYIATSFNAYAEEEFPVNAFETLYADFSPYPHVCLYDDEKGRVGGYAYLRPFRKFPCFDRAAEITYFLAPEYTGKGHGSAMLARIMEGARAKGVRVILAHISSLNEGSINFHRREGFSECGRFKGVLEKRGVVFDMVWMQKDI